MKRIKWKAVSGMTGAIILMSGCAAGIGNANAAGNAGQDAVEAKPDQAAIVDFNTCAKPEWNKADLDAGHEGTVTLSFLISSSGQVENSDIVKSSGYPGMDKAAQAGIGKCRFKPGMKDGKPVRVWQKLQYVWVQH